jgi:hypothetical protein
MPAWKVLLIGAFACLCMGLATATFVIPFTEEGNQRWLWMGGLFVATLAAGGLFTLFLRKASGSLGARPGGYRR